METRCKVKIIQYLGFLFEIILPIKKEIFDLIIKRNLVFILEI